MIDKSKYIPITTLSPVFVEQVLKHCPFQYNEMMNQQKTTPRWIFDKIRSALDKAAKDNGEEYGDLSTIQRVTYFSDKQLGSFDLYNDFPHPPSVVLVCLSDLKEYVGGQFIVDGQFFPPASGSMLVIKPKVSFDFKQVTDGKLELMQFCVF